MIKIPKMESKDKKNNISIENHGKEITVVKVEGNLLTNLDVENVLEQIGDDINISHIILDLSHLEYVSSSGLTLFIRLLTKTRISNKQLILCNLQEKLEKLFRITKLYDIFALSNSVEEAIKTLK